MKKRNHLTVEIQRRRRIFFDVFLDYLQKQKKNTVSSTCTCMTETGYFKSVVRGGVGKKCVILSENGFKEILTIKIQSRVPSRHVESIFK